MTSTQNPIATAIFDKLSAGTALINLLGGTFIYHMQGPDKKLAPYVVYNLQGGGLENITPKDMWNGVWLVQGISSQGASAAGSIDIQLATLLHKSQLSVSDGWANFWCVRETDVANVQLMPNNQPLYSSGGMYRIRLSK